MSQHINWPSIEQFRNVVKNVTHKAQYRGVDIDGNVIMNRGVIKPKLKFEGTTKCHGTNSAVVGAFNDGDFNIWYQSRENIITPIKDNAGFAAFAHHNNEVFRNLLADAGIMTGAVNPTIAIFGEWCGKGIQKGVAISELPKMFVVFGIALVHETGEKTWFTRNEISRLFTAFGELDLLVSGIYHIWQFPTFEMEIDFEHPELAQNDLAKLTEQVEAECPVGKALGISNGCGEGIVWRCVEPGWEDSGYWFKVKGLAHSVTKVKTLALVDIEKVNSIKECVEQICTENRMEQIWQKFTDHDMKIMGAFLKDLAADIFKEELDTITGSGLNCKEVGKEISNVGRRWFINNLGE